MSDFVLRLTCIVLNNVFVVNDSIEYIQNGEWERKRFFLNDPSAQGQVISELERQEKTEEAKAYLKSLKRRG